MLKEVHIAWHAACPVSTCVTEVCRKLYLVLMSESQPGQHVCVTARKCAELEAACLSITHARHLRHVILVGHCHQVFSLGGCELDALMVDPGVEDGCSLVPGTSTAGNLQT